MLDNYFWFHISKRRVALEVIPERSRWRGHAAAPEHEGVIPALAAHATTSVLACPQESRSNPCGVVRLTATTCCLRKVLRRSLISIALGVPRGGQTACPPSLCLLVNKSTLRPIYRAQRNAYERSVVERSAVWGIVAPQLICGPPALGPTRVSSAIGLLMCFY